MAYLVCGRVVWLTTRPVLTQTTMDEPISAVNHHQTSEPAIWTVHGKYRLSKSLNMNM